MVWYDHWFMAGGFRGLKTNSDLAMHRAIQKESYTQDGRWDNGQDRVTFTTPNSVPLYYLLRQDNFDSPGKEHKEHIDPSENTIYMEMGWRDEIGGWMVAKMSMFRGSVVSSCTAVGWDDAGCCGVGTRNKLTHDNVTQKMFNIQLYSTCWYPLDSFYALSNQLYCHLLHLLIMNACE